MIRDSTSDFLINLDPDVRRIRPKILWMHYFVGVSHFAKYGTNRLLIVWKLRKQRSAKKCPKIAHSSVVKKINKWCGIHAQISITTKSQSLLEGHLLHACLPSLVDGRFRVRQLSCLQNDRTNERMTENDHITSALLAVVIIIIMADRTSLISKV